MSAHEIVPLDGTAREDILADMLARTPPGWYGYSTPEGWDAIVFDCHRRIAALLPDYEIYQIKEKFGTLRYYCSSDGDERVRAIINAAEAASAVTCETCGQPGLLREGSWWRTLCELHAQR